MLSSDDVQRGLFQHVSLCFGRGGVVRGIPPKGNGTEKEELAYLRNRGKRRGMCVAILI